MRVLAHRLGTSAVVVLFSLLGLAVPALVSAEEAGAPRSAFDKHDREDLAAPLREQGEIRVIVGLRGSEQAATRPRGRGNDAADQAFRREVDDDQTRLLQRHQRQNLRHVKRFREHRFVAMTVDAAALEDLLADPEVTSVAEDRPLYPILYHTPGITRADKAWAAGYKGAGQVVAIIDSGVDKNHPFLAGKVVAEACFSRPVGSNTSYCPAGTQQSTAPGSGLHCPDSSLTCWHGTHVAGIVAGKYGVLSSTTGGVAPEANLIAIQVFQKGCNTSGCYIEAYNSDIALALEHVYSLRHTHNIAAVNMSLGGGDYTAACDAVSPAMTTIINNLRSANIATVVASGNAGRTNAISFPACISSAVSVGSTNKQNAVSSFSNSANFLSLLAPGGAVTSSTIGTGYIGANGTSMAAPHVAGAWALLKSAKPAGTVQELLTALQTTGIPVTDTRNGIVKPLIQIGYDGTQPGALGQVLGHGNVPPSVALTSPAGGASYGAPASITLAANATDSDGSIAKVEFLQGGTKVGEVLAPGPYSFIWENVAAGSYALTARATDNLGGTSTSSPVNVTVTGSAAVSVNVAAQVNGGVASASSAYPGYLAAKAINGARQGGLLSDGTRDMWLDGNSGSFPDWLQVNFNGVKSVAQIDVFTMQDNWTAPVEPTPTMTFAQYGITNFNVQYWNGSAWLDVPGGNVTGNNLVWRRLTFAPITTDRIRIMVNAAMGNTNTRITEIEAWTATGGGSGDTTAPSAPTGLAATGTTSSATTLSWNPSSDNVAVTGYKVFRNGTEIATVTSGTSYPDSGLAPSTPYSYTVAAFDAANNTSAQSIPLSVTTSSAGSGGESINVALQANGGVASASSAYPGYLAAKAINGGRKGEKLPDGTLDTWLDGNSGGFPDWLQVNFDGLKTIGQIDVFTLQDTPNSPLEPTPTMTFALYGITNFNVQYWNGSAWVSVPGGNVTGNNLVWRRLSFAPISTDRIRITVNAAMSNTYTRITEIEAWTATGI